MRLWTLHPRYLDSRGLVAAWREALLAQKVLAGKTKGYRFHPQLVRFQARPNPLAAIGAFLAGLAKEAERRGYHFNARKILRPKARVGRIPETRGQLLFEWRHLKAKLRVRSPRAARTWRSVAVPEPHPLFRVVAGGVRPWEKGGLEFPLGRIGSPRDPTPDTDRGSRFAGALARAGPSPVNPTMPASSPR